MRRDLSSSAKTEDLLKTLVSVRSDTGTDMNPVADCASEMLEERGYRVMRYSFSPKCPCIVASYAALKKEASPWRGKLILHCHLDTAPFGEPEWKTDPLGGREIKGRIFGRGALDCKGLAAVWIQLLGKLKAEAYAFPFDIVFVAASDEERDGSDGISALLDRTSECEGAFLAMGEGGGYPVRTRSGVYLTLQTGEMEADSGQPFRGRRLSAARVRNFARHARRGTFSRETLRYFVESFFQSKNGTRRLAASPFETECSEGGSCRRLPPDSPGVPGFVLEAARKALRVSGEQFRILPVVSRGHSDNRHFRNRGIPAIGFFPLSEHNSLKGIHAANEYVSLDSLRFAEEVLESTIINIGEALRG